MGWFDGWFSSSGRQSDPFRKLDPELREFLEKESPVKYNSIGNQPSSTGVQRPQAQEQPTSLSTEAAAGEGRVPPQSLYKDGRYAEIWKTYRSQAEVEAETKDDHDKLMDVLHAFKDRKMAIGRAALENCADENVDWNTCLKEGSWKARMMLCRTETRKFERCYMMQSVGWLLRDHDEGWVTYLSLTMGQKLLKALGYLETYGRGPEIEEQIQMRADKIYHRMLEQEIAAEKAAAEGQPTPNFPPLLDKPRQEDEKTAVDANNKWPESIEKLPETERTAEIEAAEAESRHNAQVAFQIQQHLQQQGKQKEERQAAGMATVGDKIKTMFGK